MRILFTIWDKLAKNIRRSIVNCQSSMSNDQSSTPMFQSSIANSKWSIRRGFTLIELLAVIVVIVSLGAIIISIVTSVLRGNNKTNAINTVQTNGDYAITQVAKSIRNATTLLVPSPCGSINSPTATSSVQLAFPDGTTTTYSCLDTNNQPSITSNSAALIDTNAVSVVSCKFICGQNSLSDYPVIGVDFFLQSKGSSILTEQKASGSAIEFQTSVIMRNFLR